VSAETPKHFMDGPTSHLIYIYPTINLTKAGTQHVWE